MGQANVVNFIERADGAGRLVRLVPKVDSETEETLQWDADLAFSVGDDEAAAIEVAIPSAGEHRSRATDGDGSAVVTYKPTQDAVIITLSDMDGNAILSDVSATIRHLQMRTTEKLQVFVARVRLRAVKAMDSGPLCRHLGKKVGIVVEPTQRELPFNKAPEPEVGMVVNAKAEGKDVYGVFKSKDGDGFYIVADFGTEYRADRIISALRVADATKRNGHVADYAKRVKESGGHPTWKHLVLALGQSVGNGTAAGAQDTGWALTAESVEAAVGMAAN